MRVTEVIRGNRIYLEILPDEPESSAPAAEQPSATTVAELVPDSYQR